MKDKLKQVVVTLFFLLVTLLIGAETSIQHQIVIENPKKEVTTIESKKLRDKAELNINIKKQDIEEIPGSYAGGKTIFMIPKEKGKLIEYSDILVLEKFDSLVSKKIKNNIKNLKSEVIVTPETNTDNVVVDDLLVGKSVYLVKYDKITKDIIKVYKGVPLSSELQISTMGVRSGRKWLGSFTRNIGDRTPIVILDGKEIYDYKKGWWWYGGHELSVSISSLDEYNVMRNHNIDPYDYSAYIRYTKRLANLVFNWDMVNADGSRREDRTDWGAGNGSIGYVRKGKTNTDAYGHIYGWTYEGKVYLKARVNSAQLGIYTIKQFFKINYDNKWYYDEGFADIVVKDDSTKSAYLSLKQTDIELNKEYELKIDGHQEISFYQKSNPNNIRILKDGIQISKNARAVLASENGTQYELFYKQIDNEFAKPYIKFLKINEKDHNLKSKLEVQSYFGNNFIQKIDLDLDLDLPIIIERVVYKIDNRLTKKSEKWYDSRGNLFNNLGGNSSNNYEELIDMKKYISHIPDGITPLERERITGRPKYREIIGNNEVWTPTSGNWIGESAIPKFLSSLNNFEKDLRVSYFNEGRSEYTENQLVFKGKNKKYYYIDLQEKIGSEPLNGYDGSGTINISDILENNSIEFSKNASSGKVESLDRKIIMDLNGKLPQPQGYRKENIITKIIVTKNTETPKEINSIEYESENYNLEISRNNGNLILKKKKSDASYNDKVKVEYYYKDIKLGQFILNISSSMKDTGLVTFKIDGRLNKTARAGKWYSLDGTNYEVLTNSPVNNYKEMVYFNDNGYIIPAEALPLKAIEIAQRPIYKKEVFQNLIYTPFSSDVGESAMPKEITSISDFKSKLKISYFNGATKEYSYNRFRYKGTDRNGYSITLKEEIGSEVSEELNATLDLSDFKIGSWGSWQANAGGSNIQASGGTGYILKVESGKLTNTRGYYGNYSIVTRVVIKDGKGNILVDKEGDIKQNVIVTTLPNNDLGFTSNGEFFISKKKDKIENSVYEIISYYKNVELGKINLKVKNSSSIDMKNITYKIDNRLNNILSRGMWFDANGNNYQSQSDASPLNNYRELVEFNDTTLEVPESVTSLNALAIDGRTILRNTIKNNKVYTPTSSSWIGESAIPTKVTSKKDFQNKLLISFNNDNNSNYFENRLVFTGSNNLVYHTNIIERVGIEPINGYIGQGEVNIVSLPVDSIATFDKNLSDGKIESKEKNLTMSLIGNLPQTQGYRNGNIVSRLVITKNGGTPQVIRNLRYIETNYDIYFDGGNGNLSIKKKTENLSYDDKLKIEYYYQDIKLGEFNLNIRAGVRNVGEVIYKIDKRLKESLKSFWFDSLGNTYTNYDSTNKIEDYSELVQFTNNLNIPSNTLLNPKLIVGRENFISENIMNKYYKKFYTNEDESAIPKKVTSNQDFKNKLRVSFYNSGDIEALNNIFVYLKENDDGEIYYANVKEEIGNEFVATGTGTINIGTLPLNKSVSFDKNLNSGIISSKDGIASMVLSGKLPQTQGYKKENIVTKLKVTSDGDPIEVSGNSYEDENYIVGLDEINGNLTFTKKKVFENPTIKIIKLEYFYKDIKLGEFMVNLKSTVNNLGEAIFKADDRVTKYMETINAYWIDLEGNIYKEYDSLTPVKELKNLIQYSGNLNIPAGISYLEDIRVEGRDFFVSSNQKNKYFKVNSSREEGASAIPRNITSNQDFKKKLRINLKNSIHLDENNEFIYVDPNNKENIYKYNLKEITGLDINSETIAKVDLTEFPVNTWGRWSLNANGRAKATSGQPYILNINSGYKIFNTTGYSNKSLVTKLVVKQNGKVLKEQAGNVGNKIQVDLLNNTFGFESNGEFFISKHSMSSVLEKYEIVAYYNGVKLGVLNLEIVNDNSSKNLGKINYKIDKRLNLFTNRGNWFDVNGNNYKTLNSSPLNNYSAMIQYDSGNLNIPNNLNLISQGIEGLKYNRGSSVGGQVQVFTKEASSWIGESAISNNVSSKNDFNKKIRVSISSNNSNTDVNKLLYKGSDQKKYSIELIENIGNESSETIKAELNTSKFDINTWGRWPLNAQGASKAIAGQPYILNIEADKKMFNTTGYTDASIVTKLVVKQNGILIGEANGSIGKKIQIRTVANLIGIESNGEFFVDKKQESKEIFKYEIVAYYKDVKLGTLNLDIKN